MLAVTSEQRGSEVEQENSFCSTPAMVLTYIVSLTPPWFDFILMYSYASRYADEGKLSLMYRKTEHHLKGRYPFPPSSLNALFFCNFHLSSDRFRVSMVRGTRLKAQKPRADYEYENSDERRAADKEWQIGEQIESDKPRAADRIKSDP